MSGLKVVKAHEIIDGLDAPQKKRLFSYSRQLSTNRDPKFFDSRVYADLLSFSKDEARIVRAKNYLDRIGFNQSQYDYAKIKEALVKFSSPSHSSFQWNANYKKAKELLKAEFLKFNLRTIKYRSESDIVESLPRVDTHAGFSYIYTGKKKKGEYVGELFSEFSAKCLLAKLEKSFNSLILVSARCQASGAFQDDGSETGTYKPKTRMVSMIDIYQILAELMFAKPLQQCLATVDWYAGGKDDNALHQNIYSKARQSRTVLSLDYSSYDQTISDWLIDDAFEIIKACFTNEIGFDEEMFNIIRNDFKFKCFVDGEGNIVSSSKGVPSGSMFTQIVDSIVNKLMITTYMLSKGISDYSMMIMGDDNLVVVQDHEVSKEDVSSYITKNFGVVCNPDKCSSYSYPESFEFLSRFWKLNGVWRTPEILISKMLYPERFRDYVRNTELKAIDIISSYYLSFKLGMDEFMDGNKLWSSNVNLKDDVRERARYLSGLERYRLLYL